MEKFSMLMDYKAYHLNIIIIFKPTFPCLLMAFSFFEHIRFLPISKPLNCCFYAWTTLPWDLQSFPSLSILHISAHVSPQKNTPCSHYLFPLSDISHSLYTFFFCLQAVIIFRYYVLPIYVFVLMYVLLISYYQETGSLRQGIWSLLF